MGGISGKSAKKSSAPCSCARPLYPLPQPTDREGSHGIARTWIDGALSDALGDALDDALVELAVRRAARRVHCVRNEPAGANAQAGGGSAPKRKSGPQPSAISRLLRMCSMAMQLEAAAAAWGCGGQFKRQARRTIKCTSR